MKEQHSASNLELKQNNTRRLLTHTTTASSSNSSQSGTTANTPHTFFHRRTFSRSNSPAPIDTEVPMNRTRHSTSNNYDTTARSAPSTDTSPQLLTSPTTMSPIKSARQSSSGHRRERSYSSNSRKSSDDYRRYSGTVNHYGRHSNDWLFGGFSLRDTVREGVDRLRHGKES